MNANRQGELDFLTITVIVIHNFNKRSWIIAKKSYK